MDLYARHPETDELISFPMSFGSAKSAYDAMDRWDAQGEWPISHVPVIHCSLGWHWLCSANFADRWLPGEGKREERLVYGGYRVFNPLPVVA